MDSKTKDGQTPLHLAVMKIIEEPEDFEETKRIIKELLFNGANREAIVNIIGGNLCFRITTERNLFIFLKNMSSLV